MIFNFNHDVPETNEDRLRRLEVLISWILRLGTGISLLLVLLGLLLMFMGKRFDLNSHDELHRLTDLGAQFPNTAFDVLEGVLDLQGQAIIVAGLLLLILTPITRVVVSLAVFLRQRNMAYALITSIVLLTVLLPIFVRRLT